MAQQTRIGNFSLQDESRPGRLPSNNFMVSQISPRAGEDMSRHASNDSAYWSATSFSEDAFSPSQPPPSMSYGTGGVSPSLFEENYTLLGYGSTPVLASSPAMARTSSARSYTSRATPSTLELKDDSLLKKFYTFVVPKGKEPYFELQRNAYADAAGPDAPTKIYLDSPISQPKNTFPCQYPGCLSRGQEKFFKRPADLERHYRNVHGPDEYKLHFPCDYAQCLKTRDPFTRKDHYRDHLRDYHKEDVGCAKGERQMEREEWLKSQEAWIKERNIVPNWWRCHKCLTRIQISRSGWDCPDCKAGCDKERVQRIEAARVQAARTKPVSAAATSPTANALNDFSAAQYSYLSNCLACKDTAWIWNENGQLWDACTTCHPNIDQVYRTDDDWQQWN